MAKTTDLVDDLKQTRDELRVKMHLASMEAKEQWDALEAKWEKFAARARLEDTAGEVGDAMRALGEELRMGYERIRAALTAEDQQD